MNKWKNDDYLNYNNSAELITKQLRLQTVKYKKDLKLERLHSEIESSKLDRLKIDRAFINIKTIIYEPVTLLKVNSRFNRLFRLQIV